MRNLLLGAAVALVFSVPLGSTTLKRFDLADLTGHAAFIFVGTCVSARTELVDGRVHTRVEFAVSQVVHGADTDRIVLYLPGGLYQGKRYTLVGMPTFAPDEEVVLFLTEEDRSGHAWPVGLGQGKFRIVRSGAAARVFQELGGATLYRPSGGAAKAASPLPRLDGLPLAELLGRVRALLKMRGAVDADR